AALGTPGGFTAEGLQNRVGKSLKDVKQIAIAAGNPGTSEHWTFAVVRTTTPVKLEEMTARLSLVKAPKSPIEGLEYYNINATLDGLTRFLFGESTSEKPLTFHLYDDQTLVFAHEPAMQGFLTAKRQPQLLSKAPE